MKRLLFILLLVTLASLMVVPAFGADPKLIVNYDNADLNTPGIKIVSTAVSSGQSVVGFYISDPNVAKGKMRVDSAGNMGIETSGTGNIAYNFSGGAGDVKYWNGSGGLLAVIKNSGKLGLGVASPSSTNRIQVSNGAYLTETGVWHDASSREYKQDIKSLNSEDAFKTLEGLNPVTFAYKIDPSEHNVGFIAEDVPAMVAAADRKGISPMNIVAVLTKVVQDQQKTIAELTEKVNLLEGKVSKISHKGALSSINPE